MFLTFAYSSLAPYLPCVTQSTLYQILSLVVTLLVWVVVFLSKAMASISRSMLLVGFLVLLHAALRLPQELEKHKVKLHKRRKHRITKR